MVFGLLFLSDSDAQTFQEIIETTQKQYSSDQPLQFSSVYNLYKTNKKQKLMESYKGNFYKNNSSSFFMQINHADILSTSEVNLRVNHNEKAILVMDPNDKVSQNLDLNQFLVAYEKEGVKDFKTYWEIVLTSKKITTEPYSKIVLQISKNYLLKKQFFYFSNRFDFSKDMKKSDLSQPVLEVVYSKYSTDKTDENKFRINKYISISNSNTIKLSQKIKGYELIDRRTLSNKIYKKN